MAREIKPEYGKLVTFTETVELTEEDWDKMLAYVSRRHPIILGGIQTGEHQNHWLTNYMEFCNGQRSDDDGHSEDAHPA